MTWRFVHMTPADSKDPSVLMVDAADDADATAQAQALYPGATIVAVNDDGEP